MGILSGGNFTDMKRPDRRARVLVAKIGLDGHNRGAYVVAHGLRQAGMEVIYTGIRQTPASVARTAVQEDVDVIGISSMVGAHLSIVKRLRKDLEGLNASDIPIIIGGIIPEGDYDLLSQLGAHKIFPPGSEVKKMVQYIHSILEGAMWVTEVPGSLTGEKMEDLHLQGSRCERCGRIYFMSRRNCPHCLDRQSIKSVQLSDKGTLQSFVVASVAPPGYDVPHAQGYIDLDEDGPRIFSLLTDFGDGSKLRIDDRVELKVIKCGSNTEKKPIMGYRFRPVF